MLGRTNLLFVEGDNTSEIAFTPDYILTSTSGSIRKIEYINNLFFLFASDEVVLYGSDINSLQTLKNGDEIFKAKHIIYADGVYYMTKIEKTSGKAIIYKTADLISFEEITLKTGTSSYSYPVHGLFLNSKGEIVALIEEFISTSASSNRCQKFLLIVESLTDYQEESAKFIELGTSYYIYSLTATSTVMRKDRIFTSLYAGSSTSTTSYMITLDGTMRMQYDRHSYFAADYFFKTATNALYYSLNAIDYINLNFSDHVDKFNAINVFEYDGNIALIYRCTENDKTVTKLIVAATPKELPTSISSAIPVTIDYSMQYESNVYVDDYVYLGSDGGIVIKGKIDNVEVERPDVVVVKGLAAKEALKQANDYTDEKYKNITNEVELHEETTRQYMENAFSATPEGYAALVDTVSENKVKIDTIIEKSDLSIKADASGEEIHLTDSDDDKVQEFALYGKAKQNTTQGNQLFNYDAWKNIAISNGTAVFENNGITITANGDDSYTEYRTNVPVPYPQEACIPVNEGDILTLSWEEDTNKQGRIYLFPNGGSNGIVNANNNKNKKLIYTARSGVTFITFRFGVDSAGDTISYKNIMINKGSEPLPYEPYSGGMPSPNPQYPQPIEVSGESGSVAVTSSNENNTKTTTAIIPTENGLAGIKVTENGNYTDQNGQQWICDEIVKYADGSGEKIQRFNSYVFNGTEKWNTSSSVSKRYILATSLPLRPKKGQAPLSNMFVGSVNTRDLNKCHIDPNGSFYFNTDFDTADDFNAHLAENNMIAYYELENPIRTPLTAEEIAEIEKLHTFYPVTNISNDAECGMSVKYHADSKNYIDRMVAEQVASIVANMNK